MAGRGPAPKPAVMRQRRNKKSTKTTLSGGSKVKAPELTSTIDWHPLTRAEWKRIWASPMASEFTEADRDGLVKLAILVNDFYFAQSSGERKALAAEIRLQRADFGLTPRARAGLQWEIERADEAKAKNDRRRRAPAKAEKTRPLDPRGALRVVEGGKA
ncbi:MAG: hypothetical protein WAU42_14725 [Solirubrobacteraceae bacterium]